MSLKRVFLFTAFSRLKSLPCPSSTYFAGQLAHVIGPLKCYNDDYQCYDYQCYPRFTLISAFYPLIRVLLSYPRFTLSSAFYSYPCFTHRNNRYRMRTPSISQSKFCLHKMADFEGHFNHRYRRPRLLTRRSRRGNFLKFKMAAQPGKNHRAV